MAEAAQYAKDVRHISVRYETLVSDLIFDEHDQVGFIDSIGGIEIGQEFYAFWWNLDTDPDDGEGDRNKDTCQLTRSPEEVLAYGERSQENQPELTTISYQDKKYEIRQLGWRKSRWAISETKKPVGHIVRKGWLHLSCIAAVPKELPLAVGVFMILSVITDPH